MLLKYLNKLLFHLPKIIKIL